MNVGVLFRASRRTRGSVTVAFVSFVLPVLFLLFVVGFDLARYVQEEGRIQGVLDDAGKYGYQYLPNSELARSVAVEFLRAHNFSGHTEVVVNPSAISLNYRGGIESIFAGIFGVNGEIPVQLFSRIGGLPHKALILIEDGSDLAPALDDDSPWGSSSAWPTARSIESSFGKFQYNSRIVTQQCFNPTFSALKMAAIYLFEHLAASPENSVQFEFFPGTRDETERVRFPITEEYFVTSSHPLMTHSHCYAIASEFGENVYSFPNHANVWSHSVTQELGAPNLVSSSDFAVTPALLPDLSMREVIWSRLVQGRNYADFGSVLGEAVTSLVGGNGEGDKEKAAYFFAAGYPRAAGTRFPAAPARHALAESLRKYRSAADDQTHSASLQAFYVMVAPDGGQDSVQSARVLQEFFDEALGANSLLRMKVISAVPERLMNEDALALLARAGYRALEAR